VARQPSAHCPALELQSPVLVVVEKTVRGSLRELIAHRYRLQGEAMSWQPEQYRDVLKLMVRRLYLDGRFRQRYGSSDLVQDTLLKAHNNVRDCHAADEPGRLRWLHAILMNVVRDRLSGEGAAKRDLAREVPLNAALAESSARLERWLADPAPSPARAAERHELLAAVARALETLSEDQREAILRHHTKGERTREIAAHMGRTADAVKLLLYRGLKELRQRLQGEGVSWP